MLRYQIDDSSYEVINEIPGQQNVLEWIIATALKIKVMCGRKSCVIKNFHCFLI